MEGTKLKALTDKRGGAPNNVAVEGFAIMHAYVSVAGCGFRYCKRKYTAVFTDLNLYLACDKRRPILLKKWLLQGLLDNYGDIHTV